MTITASFEKIFSSVPAVGYFAQHDAFRTALADGKTSFGTAKSVEAMDAVVRNTMIQGVLSIIFVTLSIIVIVTAIQATWRAYRSHGSSSSEDPAVPSRIFAPAGFVPTPASKELLGRWDEYEKAHGPADRAAHR